MSYKRMINGNVVDIAGSGGSGGGGASEADQVSYDNSISGLVSVNVQAAIDEVYSDVTTLSDDKIDKVEGAVSGNIPKLDENGNLVDSGHQAGVLLVNPTDETFKNTPGAIWVEA